MKIPKSIVVIATVLVVSGLVFYYAFMRLGGGVSRELQMTSPGTKPEPNVAATNSKEVSATTTYSIAEVGKTHQVKFTLMLDEQGMITGTKLVEMPQGEASDKQKEFSGLLTTMIQGKKLSELTKVDKVGKSTITTDAFNSVLGDLQAQL
ncbi:MAG: hypothetical protein E6P95_01975 [Candidatus Moraniibacteriota bacterium]|nr:MAG: hypothetical protein E6P95_01975 [Candidatus Moranbacteria bacterium]